MKGYIEKAELLIEALPYFKAFNGSKVVIKYGGSAMIDEKLKSAVMEDIILMKYIGVDPIIVHGGGKEISSQLKKVGKETKFIDGCRVTDHETMEITEMVLSGKVGKSIVRQLHVHGVNAVGISGKDGGLLTCESVAHKEMGCVGNVTHVKPQLLHTLINDDFIPVISPVGIDDEGNTYNINADQAALAIASALEADKLIYLTDVPGVLSIPDQEDSLLSVISSKEIKGLIKSGVISGGMIPKINCCKEAVDQGVSKVHILDGRVPHSMLIEMFTDKGIGTMVVPSHKGMIYSQGVG